MSCACLPLVGVTVLGQGYIFVHAMCGELRASLVKLYHVVICRAVALLTRRISLRGSALVSCWSRQILRCAVSTEGASSAVGAKLECKKAPLRLKPNIISETMAHAQCRTCLASVQRFVRGCSFEALLDLHTAPGAA